MLSWRHQYVALETGCLAETLVKGDRGDQASRDILGWLHDQDYSPYTVQGTPLALRVFASTVRDEMPERFEEIEPGKHLNENSAPLPSNVIDWADGVKIAEAAEGTRDQVVLVVEGTTSLRGSWSSPRQHFLPTGNTPMQYSL